VDTLLAAGLTVFVIPPGQVKKLRSRYGPAGSKNDRSGAYVLADVVRTDARRLRPLERDSDQTAALRSAVRARQDLVRHRVAAANQLRAHLEIVFPAAAALLAEIDSEITLAFLSRFTTQEQPDWLSPPWRAAWLKSVSYSGRTDPAVLHARLLAAPPRPGRPARQRPRRDHRRPGCRPADPERPDPGPGRQHRRPAGRPPRRGDLPVPAPAPAPSAPPGCSPRSATPAAASPPVTPWPAWPESRPPPASPGRSKPSHSAGEPTNSSATPCATSPQTPAEPAPGPPASTTKPSPAAATTPTPSASSPAPGPHVIWRCWQNHTPYDPAAHNSLQALLNHDQPIAA
jgi:hypothetical protein